MTEPRSLPAGDRPGRLAWPGPAALVLGVLSWPIPVAGVVVALAAIALAIVSVSMRVEYRVDWTAVVGAVVATGQLTLSGLLSLV
jgi:hypothetical protein